VLKLDSSGKVLTSFGAGLFVFPHKIHVDPEGNIWVVDARGPNERERKKNPQEKPKGHTVVKFSPEGKVLLTIGGRASSEIHPSVERADERRGRTERRHLHRRRPFGSDVRCAAGHSRPDLEVHERGPVRQVVRQARHRSRRVSHSA
jgi:hypothetical protein